MINTLLLFIALFVTWFIFSGFTDSFFLISGLVSCMVAVYFARKMNVINRSKSKDTREGAAPIYVRPRAFLYALWLLKEMLFASIDVTLRVWRVELKISPVRAWLPLSQQTEEGRALYANSITLTPGTVCVNVDDDMLEVHTISQSGIDSLLEGDMDRKVTKVAG